jgi:hypothetical protein
MRSSTGGDNDHILISRSGVMQASEQKQIFISHMSEEKELAKILKKYIKKYFDNRITVFFSSDPTSIPLAQDWVAAVPAEIEKSLVILVICSPDSYNRPWINFEVGCAKMKKCEIIPICHSGLKKEGLDMNLRILQATDIGDPTFEKSLLYSIGKCFGLPVNLFEYKDGDLRKDLFQAANKIKREKTPEPIAPKTLVIEDNPMKRTELIVKDLEELLKKPEDLAATIVWNSAFLSIFAINETDEKDYKIKDYFKLLLREREILLNLARNKAKIKTIISPVNFFNPPWNKQYSMKRTKNLLDLFDTNDKALENIDWAISEARIKNFYIIGHKSIYEGFKIDGIVKTRNHRINN